MKTDDFRFEIFKGNTIPSVLVEQIDDLCERSILFNPYFSRDWLEAWLKRQSKEGNLVFVTAKSSEKSLEGFWPFVQKPGILGSKGLWPFVFDEANYFHPICSEEGGFKLVDGVATLLKDYLFC